MILIGAGSNVPGPGGTPEETVARVGFELGRGPVGVERVSRPVQTTPFGVSEQPPLTNAALAIETDLPLGSAASSSGAGAAGWPPTGLRLRDDGVPCPLFSSATAAARSAMDERERLSATEREPAA